MTETGNPGDWASSCSYVVVLLLIKAFYCPFKVVLSKNCYVFVFSDRVPKEDQQVSIRTATAKVLL